MVRLLIIVRAAERSFQESDATPEVVWSVRHSLGDGVHKVI
jgi:hypothetical protein